MTRITSWITKQYETHKTFPNKYDMHYMENHAAQ